MARIVSRILCLDELAPEIAEPAPAPEATVGGTDQTRRRNQLLGYGGLCAGLLVFLVSRPLGIFVLVSSAVWYWLTPAVCGSAAWPPHPRRRPRQAMDLWRRRRLALDEPGLIGLEGEVETLRHLARLPDEYVVIHNAIVPTPTGTTQLDVVVVTADGVWCLEVKAWVGWIFGSAAEPTWTQVKRYARQQVKDRRENPVLQNAYHCAALNDFLAARGHRAPVRSLVVLTRGELKTALPDLVAPLSSLATRVRQGRADALLTPEQVTQIARELAELAADAPLVEEAGPVPAPAWLAPSLTVPPPPAAAAAEPVVIPPPVPLAMAPAAPPPWLRATCRLLLAAGVGLVGGAVVALMGAYGLTALGLGHVGRQEMLLLGGAVGVSLALRVLTPEKRGRARR